MGRDLASEARRWLGTPYRYGGRDRNGTDCSGLVMELYRTVCAMKIPRTTVEQKSYCTKVARNKARMGDLVFFGSGKSENSVSHVGLYIGKGEMIHASSSRGVMVSRVDAGYWGDRFRGIGRIDGAYASWAKTDRGAKSSKKKRRITAVKMTFTHRLPRRRKYLPLSARCLCLRLKSPLTSFRHVWEKMGMTLHPRLSLQGRLPPTLQVIIMRPKRLPWLRRKGKMKIPNPAMLRKMPTLLPQSTFWI